MDLKLNETMASLKVADAQSIEQIAEMINKAPGTTEEHRHQAFMFIQAMEDPKVGADEEGTIRVFDKNGVMRLILGRVQ